MTTHTPLDHQQAVRRWKLGHHLFHLHLTSMNTLLDDALRALGESDWPPLLRDLRRLRALYDAATASMRYAADFRQELYEDLIRPSMSPPFLSPGFSGLLNPEHALMLERLGTLRREFKAAVRQRDIPPEIRVAGADLWSAQSRNRRNHMLVCERFVPGGTSLLKEYFAGQHDHTNQAPQGEEVLT